MDEICVFHNFCEKKAILEIRFVATTRRINIADFAKATTNPGGSIDSDECVPRPFLVLAVSCHAVRIVKALQYLRPEFVRAIGNKEATSPIECCLICWQGCHVPRKALGPNAGQSGVVRGVAS